MLHMLHVLHMLHGLRSALLPEAGFGTQVWTRGPFHVGAVGAFVAFEGTRPTIVCYCAYCSSYYNYADPSTRLITDFVCVCCSYITLIRAQGSSQTSVTIVAVEGTRPTNLISFCIALRSRGSDLSLSPRSEALPLRRVKTCAKQAGRADHMTPIE